MDYRSIVISGASSGIGRALAAALAAPDRHLSLLGRDTARLEAAAEMCRSRGATCETVAIDILDRPAISAALARIDAGRPVDLLIANAGILDGRRADQACEARATARQVLETNLLAPVDMVHVLLPAMCERRSGDIILVASLAAFVPLPDAPAYSASKAGLLSYGIALRDAVAPSGVRVVVACPGFVSTAMANIHLGPRPGEISSEEASRRILDGLRRNRSIIGFPAPASWLSRLALVGPEFLRRRGLRATRFSVGGQAG